MLPVKPKTRHKSAKTPVKKHYPEVRDYLLRAIRMHQEILKSFKPLSDEWTMCQSELFKYKTDFEILERGTYEERKEVIEKYG